MHVPIIRSAVQRQLWVGLGHSICEFHVYSARQASTSAPHPFPFPSGLSPAPHEIFHLPRNASQAEIKSRYIDLVKIYHPDAHFAQRAPPAVRNARFRAITHAYNVLRGRGGFNMGSAADMRRSSDDLMRAELRRRRRRYTPERTVPEEPPDDAQLTYVPFAIVLVGVVTAMSLSRSHLNAVRQHTQSAAANLAEAHAGAEEYGMQRRRMIRERVKEMQEAPEVEVSEMSQIMEKTPRELSDPEDEFIER